MIQPSPSSQSDPGSLLGEPWGEVDALTSSLEGQPVERLSPIALAYLGDAIYELYIRQYYLFPPRRIAQYHQLVVAQVRAERQATQLQLLLPQLTPEELTMVRRGRNATHRRPPRLAPEIYQQATSLETLVGYLYLTNPQRLHDLLVQLQLD
ncbi:ribonuclease III [Spirulina subsalsa FACHB-351]|uniref:Mini-ribonuclease 3 n=1 Tax=Spirulina subsalsa FACHB-351 TaxID=234711 RepID=A0ABT3L2Y9_9CYAN|nr:ribonuclease III domain-containing protein [Spirulina subsalsa]MCW6035454.1 ribonuclease III [Spirulina subsalsa FACHB-351]